MSYPYTCVLFDLDGTIADSAPGITACLAQTFEQLGMPIPSPAKLLEFVGPPILESFEELAGMTPVEATAALAIYRGHYLEHGVGNVSIYPGLADVLRRIHESPMALSLATSKPESLARMALTSLGVIQYLDVLTGASEDEVRSAKADVVAEALVRLRAIGADVSRPVMIGDRSYDVEGAAAHGVPTIFVEWGYGSPAEQVGTVGVAATADDLAALLGL
jgi:phosphoglycolate phosphatase